MKKNFVGAIGFCFIVFALLCGCLPRTTTAAQADVISTPTVSTPTIPAPTKEPPKWLTIKQGENIWTVFKSEFKIPYNDESHNMEVLWCQNDGTCIKFKDKAAFKVGCEPILYRPEAGEKVVFAQPDAMQNITFTLTNPLIHVRYVGDPVNGNIKTIEVEGAMYDTLISYRIIVNTDEESSWFVEVNNLDVPYNDFNKKVIEFKSAKKAIEFFAGKK